MRVRFSVAAWCSLGATGCLADIYGVDLDGDGVTRLQGDCWDAVEGPEGTGLAGADIYPGATDTPYDGVDADCAGDDDFDLDADGWVTDASHVRRETLLAPGTGAGHRGAGDCDDEDATVNPMATEVCDGLDNDCDGMPDDQDDDLDASTAVEFFRDADGDAWGRDGESAFACALPAGFASRPGDCDDADPTINPDAQEVCGESVDEDCDGLIKNEDDDSLDPSTGQTWYLDEDDDGFAAADAAGGQEACSEPADGDYALDRTDCDDTRADVNPDAPEVCDGGVVDEDCDGLLDDDDPSIAETPAAETGALGWYADADGDGWGDPATSAVACAQPPGFVADNTDCDDDASTCALDCASDADSDGVPDCQDACEDVDGDDHGADNPAAAGCIDAAGAPCGLDPACLDSDCDDGDASINPAATEVCDASDTDEDCDGLADDADSSVDSSGFSTFYRDNDSDGYGDAAVTITQCDPHPGYVSDSTDCDDFASAINPGAQEICDAADTDEDCDGFSDDDDTSVDAATHSTFYADADSDSFGDAANTLGACDLASGYVGNDDDCDDDASTCASDCTGDADGDGVINCKDACTDADEDDYGTDNTAATGCLDAAGASCVLDAACFDSDCDDGDSAINPAATEVCDAADTDEDCDGLADDDDPSVDTSGFSTWYSDGDSDGYGDASASISACDQPSGAVTDSTDCDDTESSVNPGADEICSDGFDTDCDGDALTSRSATATLPDCEYSDAGVDIAHVTLSETLQDNSSTGSTVRILDDLDGDGVADLAVGGPGFDAGSMTNSGRVYIVTDVGGLNSDLDTAATATTLDEGARMNGVANNDLAGTAVTSGDFVSGSSSPYAEVFISAVGAPAGGGTDGAVYLFDAGTSTTFWDSGASLSTATAVAYGLSNGDGLGASLSADGDTDGDGSADLLAGAPNADSASGYALLLTGATYDSSGFTDGGGTTPNLRWDAKLEGSAAEEAGHAVHLADLDGDGIADALVGAPEFTSTSVNRGVAYLVPGPMSGTIALSGEDLVLGPLSGNALAGADCGWSVSAADTNGDGYDDALVGCRGINTADGGVYILNGGTSFFSASGGSALSPDAILEGGSNEQAGTSVSTAGDTDGDGLDEVLVGARANNSDTGAAYLAFGPFTGTVTLSTSTDVVQLTGVSTGDEAGVSVHGDGDVNGDGYDDFVVGARSVSGAGSNRGAAYLFYGLGL